MARVTAYETSDGELLRDKRSYIRYESNLLAAAALRKDIAEKVAASVPADQAEDVTKQVQDIVDSIGINRLREIMAIVFVEKAENAGPNDGAANGDASANGEDSNAENANASGSGAPANGEGSTDGAQGQGGAAENSANAQPDGSAGKPGDFLGKQDDQPLGNEEI